MGDVELDHVEKTAQPVTLLNSADRFDEFRYWAREIEILDERKPGNIGKTLLAIRVNKNTERQTSLREGFKLTPADHAQEQNEP
ncbi:MAG: hypothetical protein ABLT11_08550 [Candidatus Acidiferrum sp.]